VKVRLLIPVFLIAAFVAGCGGGSSTATLAPGDVAVVGNTHIVKAEFDVLMSEAKVNLQGQGEAFPKAGTTEYSTIKTQAMTLLVQQAEREAEAAKLGITVTPAEVQKQLDSVKKQYFSSDDAKYKAALKQQNLTDAEVRANIKSQLISTKLFNKLTKNVSVTPASVSLYYDKHLTSYQTPETRSVRYILIGKNKAALATSLFTQLTGAPDATWCTLAKKYSQDPASKATCGKPASPFTKGQTVAQFDKLIFSLPTKKLAKVNTTEYGWFVLQPLAAIVPAKKTPFTKEAKTIAKTLLTSKKNSFMTAWVDSTSKTYCKGNKIKYQAGYTPSPDPCAPPANTTT
jgi:parvulin-like peptidyl-prolyl isomerase